MVIISTFTQWELFAITFSGAVFLSICILAVPLRNIWISCPWHSGFCVCRRRKVTLFGLLLFLEHCDKEKLTSQWNFSKWDSLVHSFLVFVISNDSYYVELFVPALFIVPGNISALKRAALCSTDSGFYLMIQ